MSRRGSVLMEFIMVAPLMIILVSMLLQFSQIWLAREITAYAAYCACRSVLSAGSSREAELGAQRAAELACSWMCLAGMPNAIESTESGSSKEVDGIPKFHTENISTKETVHLDDGAPVPGEIIIPGWGGIPGSDSAGSNDSYHEGRWEHGDRRVRTMIIRAGGYEPETKNHDGFSWVESDRKVKYALVRVRFKFPLMLPLAGRMISWFVGPSSTGVLGNAGMVDYGSHELTEGNNAAWRGEETVMDENGELLNRSNVDWGTGFLFPVIELTEYCMLPMPYSVEKGFGGVGAHGSYSVDLFGGGS